MPADRDPAASARNRAAGARAGFADFLRWWSAELAPVIPRTARAAVRRQRLRPVLVFDGDEAALWQPVVRGGELSLEQVARVPLAADPASVAAAGRIALERVRRTAAAPRVTVALPGRQTLRRTLRLPGALEENLRQALAYDLDRHTPFKADELYFDAAVVGRDAARGEIRVDLAATRRTVVDLALQHARSWGAEVVAVSPDPPSATASSRLDLMPADRRPEGSGWRRWQIWAPAVLLVALAATAIVLPLWQKREHAIALHRDVDAARGQAGVSDALRTDLERLAGDYNFALERKFAFPPTLQVLEEVTKLLPDDTWLTQMELKTTARSKEPQRELLLRGESGNAGRLITLFEESKVFTQAAPRSPTTKIQPGPGEIFDLVAQLKPLPPPPPVTLAAAPPAPPPAPASPAAPSATPVPPPPVQPNQAAKP